MKLSVVCAFWWARGRSCDEPELWAVQSGSGRPSPAGHEAQLGQSRLTTSPSGHFTHRSDDYPSSVLDHHQSLNTLIVLCAHV